MLTRGPTLERYGERSKVEGVLIDSIVVRNPTTNDEIFAIQWNFFYSATRKKIQVCRFICDPGWYTTSEYGTRLVDETNLYVVA